MADDPYARIAQLEAEVRRLQAQQAARGGFVVRDADVLGASLADRTPSGLCSSDHAGFAVRLTVP